MQKDKTQEGKAKCRHLQYTSPFTHCIRVYSILIHTGKGGRGVGRVEPERTEPVFLNVYGAPELIPRNEYRQAM
jgi:hypothetical protein